MSDDSELLARRQRQGRLLGALVYLACLVLFVGSLPPGPHLSAGRLLLCCWGVLPSFFVTRQLMMSLPRPLAPARPNVHFEENPLLRWSPISWWQKHKVMCLVVSILLPPCWIGYGLLGSVPLLPFLLSSSPPGAEAQMFVLYLLWILAFLVYWLRTPVVKWTECDLRTRRLIRHLVQDGCHLRHLVSDQKVVGVGLGGVWIRSVHGGQRRLTESFPEVLLADGSRVQLQAGASSAAAEEKARSLARRLLVPYVGTFSAGEVVRSHWSEWKQVEPELDVPPVR